MIRIIRTHLALAGLLALSACAAGPGSTAAPVRGPAAPVVRVLSFNILEGGGDGAGVGFYERNFPGGRLGHVAAVIRKTRADVVCVQEDTGGDALLNLLGDGWHKAGHIYSRFPLESLPGAGRLNLARATLDDGRTLIVANEHWSPSNYGPWKARELHRKLGPAADPDQREIVIRGAGEHGASAKDSARTVDALAPHIKAGEAVVLCGDFNEPSHLDWTERYARHGADRWAHNPTGSPLRPKVAWAGSQRLADAGLRDAYRAAYPDEVAHPGNTWTPPYPEQTPGRVVYSDQIFDRIDRVYVAGESMTVIACSVVGESKRTSDLVYTPWPSDHRAVLAELRLSSP